MSQSVSLYAPVIEAIIQRIRIAEDAIERVEADTANSLALGWCEIAVLQVRMICELLLLGATAAHLHEGEVAVSDTSWRPKVVFQELSKVNEHPLPIPVEIHFNEDGPTPHHVTPISKPMDFQNLSKIYGICGDLLHVPSVRQVLTNRMPAFDLGQISGWISGFRRLMMAHVLMLPERQVILLFWWSGTTEDAPQGFRLDAEGPSTLNVDALPEFNLF